MAKYSLVVEKIAKKQLEVHYKSGDKASIKRINRIFEELSEHPETGIGQPERLKFDLSGYWSRQINKKDRLIYVIEDNIVTVTIISAMGHSTINNFPITISPTIPHHYYPHASISFPSGRYAARRFLGKRLNLFP